MTKMKLTNCLRTKQLKNGQRSLIVDIKSPKFQTTDESKLSSVKQAYAIQSQNDFHLECEINSQLSGTATDDLMIYWLFRSAITNRSTILKKPATQDSKLINSTDTISPESLPNNNKKLTPTPNKMTIVSRIFIDCASREHEGEYVCVAVRGPVYHSSKVELKVLIPTQENGAQKNEEKKKSCETVSYKNFGPNPARIIEYTAVIFNLEFQDVLLKCRTENKASRTTSHKLLANLVNRRNRGAKSKQIFESGENVKHVWLDNRNRQIRETSSGYELIANGDLIVRNLTYQQFGQFACITRRGNRIDSVSTFLFPIKAETKK